MNLNAHQLPAALAVLIGGAALVAASGEALAPLGEPAELGLCRPAHIDVAAEPTATEARLAQSLSRRYFIAPEPAERVVQAAYAAADEVGL